MKKILMLLTAVLIISSCATIQRSRDERNIRRFSELINSGKSERLLKMSRLPFLLDQEIIVLKKDVESFWTNILQAGFTVDEPELERGTPISEDSYLEFYDSMEVKTFFKKYLDRGTRLLELKTGKGQKILLLVRERCCSRQIRGFKGPF